MSRSLTASVSPSCGELGPETSGGLLGSGLSGLITGVAS